ncbi:RNA-directed DNA polymerase, eukaryota, reverse transcriptase zinc-binding domain protein, partial [Tanacetum coccineum]
MEKTEPTTLHVWVKMINIPMEAWSMEGISALASSLGKPKIMDEMTANMCQFGVGRTDFARVLVEIDVKEDLKDVTKIDYMGKDNTIKGTKEVAGTYVEGNKQVYKEKNVQNGGNDGNANIGVHKDQSNKSNSGSSNRNNRDKNKFKVLNEVIFKDDIDLRILKDRMLYFKDQWEINRLKEKEDKGMKEEDVYGIEEGIAQTTTDDNSSGLSKEWKELWEDVMRAKMITSGWPWMMIGDFNVTLKNKEHSKGGSRISADMQNFIDYVNAAEVEDLCSNEVFYTWIKSPLNPQNIILKKLDRAMVNEEFSLKYPQ